MYNLGYIKRNAIKIKCTDEFLIKIKLSKNTAERKLK